MTTTIAKELEQYPGINRTGIEAVGILREIPVDCPHEGAVKAREYAELAIKFCDSDKGGIYLSKALVAWKDWRHSIYPTTIKGQKFKGGRQEGSFDPLTKKIIAYLKKHPDAKPLEVWDALAKSPPKDHIFIDSPQLGKYVDKGIKPETKWRRFCNLVSEHRPKK